MFARHQTKITTSLILLLFSLLFSSCFGPSIDREVNSIGIVTGVDNVAFARKTAAHLARVAAAKQIKPDAVEFELRTFENVSFISMKVPETALRDTYVSFSRIKDGWMAQARATRSEKDCDAMSQLDFRKGQSAVTHEKLRTAYMIAESRAIEAAVVDCLQLPEDFGGKVSGTMTIGELGVEFPEKAVEITAYVNVIETSRRDLSPEEKKALLDGSIKEYSSLAEWADALNSLGKLEKLEEPSAELIVRRADIQMEMDSMLDAANSYAEAYALAPDKHELQDRQLIALRKIPEEAQTQEVKDAISKITADIAERKKEEEKIKTSSPESSG